MSLTTTNLDGLPLIGLRESPHFGLNIVVKRAMDMVLSALGLVLLSPLLALIAVLVKLTSPGPIFYRQERCGLNGRTFHMLKFRSLRVDAEQKTGAVWAVKNDPRRTPWGGSISGNPRVASFGHSTIPEPSFAGRAPARSRAWTSGKPRRRLPEGSRWKRTGQW